VIVDIQYSAGSNDWPTLRDAALRAEHEGYGTMWVLDHFDGAMVGGDRPMLEAFTLLGALAATTSRIGLGTLVANVNNRRAALLGLAASSVQRISGGRMTLGIGAGSAPGSKWAREHDERGIALHARMADRHREVAAQIPVLRATADAPIIVGAASVELATLAGELADGMNVRISHGRVADIVDAARRAAGERPFDLSAWAFLDDPTAHDRAEELGLDRLILVDLGGLGDTGLD
jgi:alkanesulfonate monooxygenase SsuD/methylene tetrahydromethanopterin reductase-like flavin-dependent oxidoreductase (luciferase family)